MTIVDLVPHQLIPLGAEAIERELIEWETLWREKGLFDPAVILFEVAVSGTMLCATVTVDPKLYPTDAEAYTKIQSVIRNMWMDVVIRCTDLNGNLRVAS